MPLNNEEEESDDEDDEELRDKLGTISSKPILAIRIPPASPWRTL